MQSRMMCLNCFNNWANFWLNCSYNAIFSAAPRFHALMVVKQVLVINAVAKIDLLQHIGRPVR